ncbi:unnamed protein product [Merluccius merluccius]
MQQPTCYRPLRQQQPPQEEKQQQQPQEQQQQQQLQQKQQPPSYSSRINKSCNLNSSSLTFAPCKLCGCTH